MIERPSQGLRMAMLRGVIASVVAPAEMSAAGVPDIRTAQELRMQRVSTVTADAAPSVGAAPAPKAPAPNAAGGGSPADQRLSQLLTSSAWCGMRYSQQMGATTTERVVFSGDGRSYQVTPLTVTLNTNGSPILNRGGKEYSRCN